MGLLQYVTLVHECNYEAHCAALVVNGRIETRVDDGFDT